MKKIFLIALFALAGCSYNLFGASLYWVGAADNSWNNTNNWSASSGGGGGAGVPGSGDVANFDGNGLVNCTLDAAVNVAGLQVAAGYTMTITQTTNTITIGNSGATFSGGTFSGGSANITAMGTVTISGCAFTNTSGTFSTNSNFTVSSGSFAHNNGRITVTASMTLTSSITGGTTFYDLNFSPTAANATYTITSTTIINVSDTLFVAGNKTNTFNTGTIRVQGVISTANAGISGGGGSATFQLNGTGTQTIKGNSNGGYGRLPNITINKTSGTLSLVGIITTVGNWTRTAGTVNEGTAVMSMHGSPTISGGPTFYDVWLAVGGTFTISDSMTVKNLLAYGGGASNCPVINTGTVKVEGDIDLSNCTVVGGSGGSGTIKIIGTGNQTITGSTGGSGRVCNVVINKSSGTLSLSGFIQPMKNWTYTAGSISAGTSTVVFYDTKTIDGTHTLANIRFAGGSASTFTISSGNTLTATAEIQINGGASLMNLDVGSIHAQGDITINNTSSTVPTGTATITINGAGSQALMGNGTAGLGLLPTIVIDKGSGTLTLASVISCAGNWIYTQGTVSPGTSTVAFYGTFNLDGQQSGSANCMPFYNVTINGNTRTLTGHLDCNNNFTIASGATCSAGSNTVYVGGDWNSAGTWTYSTSTVVFDGTNHNKIKGTGTVTFYNVTINRSYSAGAPRSVKLQNPMQVNSVMILQKGRVITDATNYLHFIDGAVCTLFNDDSAYVCGPVRKTGNDPFKFPLGDTLLHDSIAYHPLDIAAPGSATDRFQAIYSATAQTYGSTKQDTLVSISNCEYWTLERQVGSSAVSASVSWNKNSCQVDEYNDLRLAGWNGSQWNDLGDVTVTVSGETGMITMTSTLSFTTNPQPIIIGKKKSSTPYAVLQTELTGGYHTVYNGNLLFKYDELYHETGDLTYTLYDDYHRLVASNTISPGVLTTDDVVTGDNRYLLNLLDCDITPFGALESGYFLLEVVNDKGEKRFLLVKHIATISPLCPDANPPE